MNWQPIETAPKDGRFLVATSSGFPDQWILLVEADRGLLIIDCDGQSVTDATHWMPLPAPPVAELNQPANGDS